MAAPLVILAVGAVVGAVAGYAFSETTRTKVKKTGQKALKQAQESFHRLPLPMTVLEMPVSLEDYELLDGLICECSDVVINTLFGGQVPEGDLGTWAQQTTLCVLQELHPDIEWPAVPGDNPTILELMLIVGYEVRRQIQENTLCLPEETDEPESNPGGFVRPPPRY